MKDEKNPAQELREKLFAQPKHAALRMSDDEIAAAFEWCEGYKTFLSDNRTEREITAFSQKARRGARLREVRLVEEVFGGRQGLVQCKRKGDYPRRFRHTPAERRS